MAPRREGPPPGGGAPERGGDRGGAANNPLFAMRKELDQAEKDGKPEAFAAIYGRGNEDQKRQLLKYLLSKNNDYTKNACAAYLQEKAKTRQPEEQAMLDDLTRGVDAKARLVWEEALYDVSLRGILVDGVAVTDVAGLGGLLSAMDKSMTRAQGTPDRDARTLFDQLTREEQESLRPVVRSVYATNIRLAVRTQFMEGSTTNFDRYADTLLTAGAGIVDRKTSQEIIALKVLHYAGKEAIEQFNRSVGYTSTQADQAPDAAEIVTLLNLEFSVPTIDRGTGQRVVVRRRAADLFGYVVNAMRTGALPATVDVSRINNLDALMVALGVDPKSSFEGSVVKKLVLALAELPSGFEKGKGDWREQVQEEMIKDAGIFGQTVLPSTGRFGKARGIGEYTFHIERPSMCKPITLADGTVIEVRGKFGGSYFDVMMGVDAVTFARLPVEKQEEIVAKVHTKGFTSYFYHLRKLKELSLKLVENAKSPNVDLLQALAEMDLKEMSFLSEEVDRRKIEAAIRTVAEDLFIENVRKQPVENIAASYCAAERAKGVGRREDDYLRLVAGIDGGLDAMNDSQFAHYMTLQLGGVNNQMLEQYGIKVGRLKRNGSFEEYDFPALWTVLQKTRFLRDRAWEEVLPAWLYYSGLRVVEEPREVEVPINPRNLSRGYRRETIMRKVLADAERGAPLPAGMSRAEYEEYARIFGRFLNRKQGVTIESDSYAYQSYVVEADGDEDVRLSPIFRPDQLDRLVVQAITDVVHHGPEGYKGRTWEADVRRANSNIVLHTLHFYGTYLTGFLPRALNVASFGTLDRFAPRAYQWIREFSLLSLTQLLADVGPAAARFLRMDRWAPWLQNFVQTGGDIISIRHIPDVLTENGFADAMPNVHSILTAAVNVLDSPWFMPPVAVGARIDPVVFENKVFQIYAERGIGCGSYGNDPAAVEKRKKLRTRLRDNFAEDIFKVKNVGGVWVEVEQILPDGSINPEYAATLPDAMISRLGDRTGIVLVDDLVERPDCVSFADFTPRAAMTAGSLMMEHSEDNARPIPLFYDSDLLIRMRFSANSFPRYVRLAAKLLRSENPSRYERMSRSQRIRAVAKYMLEKSLFAYASDPGDMRSALEQLNIANRLHDTSFTDYAVAYGCMGERRGEEKHTGKPAFDGQVELSQKLARAARFLDLHSPKEAQALEDSEKRGITDAVKELYSFGSPLKVPLFDKIAGFAGDVFQRGAITIPVFGTLSSPGVVAFWLMPSVPTGIFAAVNIVAAGTFMRDKGNDEVSFWKDMRVHALEMAIMGRGAWYGMDQVKSLVDGKTDSLVAMEQAMLIAVTPGAGKKG